MKNIFSSFMKAVKNDGYSGEEDRFKNAIQKNPKDLNLRAQYAKFCLRHHFAHSEGPPPLEAVNQFEALDLSDLFDPEFYYLMGRFYQGTDDRKAKAFYQNGIKRFNHYTEKNPGLRQDFMEIALATAMNLMTLQTNTLDPELGKFFKSIRKSYPLHVKRVELENEIEKPEVDPARVKQLTKEVEQLKATRKSERFKPKED